MASTTSIPSTTSPKMVCFPVSHGVGATVTGACSGISLAVNAPMEVVKVAVVGIPAPPLPVLDDRHRGAVHVAGDVVHGVVVIELAMLDVEQALVVAMGVVADAQPGLD